jgi:hypothetical protein
MAVVISSSPSNARRFQREILARRRTSSGSAGDVRIEQELIDRLLAE